MIKYSKEIRSFFVLSGLVVLAVIFQNCAFSPDSSILSSGSGRSVSRNLSNPPWTGVIDPSRAIDWSSSPGPGVAGNIPSRSIQCGSTIAPFGTAASPGDPSTINSVIANCSKNNPNTFVQLGAGTFYVNNVIQLLSNVSLRGMGPDKTIIKFSGGGWGGCNTEGPVDVCFGNDSNWNGSGSSSGPDNTTSWTGGFAKGTTVITLSSTKNLSVGQLLILDQQNSASDDGFLFVCDTTNCSTEGGSAGRIIKGVDADQQEYKRVVGINGNNVTLDSGLYMPNWSASLNPGAWWANNLVQMAGIEDLTLDHAQSNNESGTTFWNAYNSWMKNVRSIMIVGEGGGPAQPGRNHVWMQYSARITVQDSYFYGTRDSHNLSYGIETWQSGDILAQNNIFQHIVSGLLIGGTSGSVFSYNYDIDDYAFPSSPTWNMPGPVFTHDAGTAMNLFEGNEGSGTYEDNIHGTHNLHTYFRNQMGSYGGLDVKKTQEMQDFSISSYARMMNIVGNVLGKAGLNNNYQVIGGPNENPTNCDTSIYQIGWQSTCDNSKGVDTANVLNTLLRWGNYDVFNNSVQWNPSEVPSGINQFSNPVPLNHSLPDSLYLTTPPTSWWKTPWGTPAWPPVGPDVTGGNVVSGTGAASNLGGHAYMIPARLCYNNTAGDTNYPVDESGLRPLLFNASSCYFSTGSSTPAPTPTPLPTAIPTPGPSPNPSPTPSASPNPSPSPIPTPSPSPTPVGTPTTTIISPINGASVPAGGSVTIRAKTPVTQIAYLDFMIDGTFKSKVTSSPYKYEWKVPNKSGVTYRLRTRSYDGNGNLVSLSPNVFVTSK